MGGYKSKYARMSVTINGKLKDLYVHRAILLAWVGPQPSENHQAAHLDGNPLNNELSNISWVTIKENNKHKIAHGTSGVGQSNAMAKISDDEAYKIIRDYSKFSSNELAESHKLSRSAIAGIATGRIRFDKYFTNFYVLNKRHAKTKIATSNNRRKSNESFK